MGNRARARAWSSCAPASTRWPPSSLKARPAGPRLEGGCHAGREDGELGGGRRASRPGRAAAEAERAVSRVAQNGEQGEHAARHVAIFELSHPPPARTAVVVVAKGVPRLPRLGFPPWTPPSEAPPPEKESPGGDQSPHALHKRRATRAERVGPLGEDRAHHGPRCVLARAGRPAHARITPFAFSASGCGPVRPPEGGLP